MLPTKVVVTEVVCNAVRWINVTRRLFYRFRRMESPLTGCPARILATILNGLSSEIK